MQRRATALTAEQIAYVRGCQRLQLAVLKLTHNYPLSALSNKFSMAALKKAILMTGMYLPKVNPSKNLV